MICALLANAVFLVNIIRILLLKIKKDTVSGEMRRALRATAFLFPLLGMNQLIFCVNPNEEEFEDAYLVINSVLQSSQGMLVAILYCFKNTQVKSLIKAAYCRHVMVRNVNNSTRVNNNSHSKKSFRRPGETIL